MKKQTKILLLFLTYFLANISFTKAVVDYKAVTNYSAFQSFVAQKQIIDLAIKSKDFWPKLLKRNAVECAVAATFVAIFAYNKIFKTHSIKFTGRIGQILRTVNNQQIIHTILYGINDNIMHFHVIDQGLHSNSDYIYEFELEKIKSNTDVLPDVQKVKVKKIKQVRYQPEPMVLK